MIYSYSVLRILLLILETVAVLGFSDPCDFPKPYYIEISLQINTQDGVNQTDVIYGLSPSASPLPAFEGKLVKPIFEAHGCSAESYQNIEPRPWIALVQRGRCHFMVKEYVATRLGAFALIVYESNNSTPLSVMTGLSENFTAAMISQADGTRYSWLIANGSEIFVTLRDGLSLNAGATGQKSSNTILLVLTSLMSPSAIVLNLLALVAIIYYPEKPKPYLYLIANLVLTDLMIACIGTSMIALMYKSYHDSDDSQKSEYEIIYKPCIAFILNDFWDLAILSNLLTLLNLTVEHFIAFRWPLKHKLLVTKRRVLVIIGVSWVAASTPLLVYMLQDAISQNVPECYASRGYCYKLHYMLNKQASDFSWHQSLVWTVIVLSVFVSMVLVYGYIIWIINKVSIRNPGFRKKRSAVITTLCLILSFLLSYIFYFIQHFYIVAEQSHKTQLLKDVTELFNGICPACHLMLDFLFTGMIGAVMDPIIYCARMKEVKLALKKILAGVNYIRRQSITSTGGYIKAMPHSINSTLDDENV